METPSSTEAQAHYARQQQIITAAVLATRQLLSARAPLPRISQTVGAYQMASATASAATVARWSASVQRTQAEAFAGVSSLGFPVIEPIIATIDRYVPAPAEALPAPWWDDATVFMREIEQLIASEVADAGRSASQTELTSHGWTRYVRILTPPSCARCTILAGRIYRWSTGFRRHPLCDCVMAPTDDERATNPLLTNPVEAFAAGQVGSHRTIDGQTTFVPGASKADLKAIADGADPIKVINATRGTTAPGITSAKIVTLRSGTRVKATTEGVTKRAAWRKANPTRLVRLRPEAIYKSVEDYHGHESEAEQQAHAIRLLKLYGYL